MGYLGCEFLKIAAQINMSQKDQGWFTVIDDSKVRMETNHFFLQNQFVGQYKTKAAETQIQAFNNNMNIIQVNVQPLYSNEKYFVDYLKNCDIIISALNHQIKQTEYLVKQSIFYQKAFLSGYIQQLQGQGAIYVPNVTETS